MNCWHCNTDSTGLGVSYIQGIIASPFANFNPEIS